MAAKNDITGDSIQTRGVSDAFRNNYDLIFGKKNRKQSEEVENGQEKTSGNEGQSPNSKS